MNLAKDIKADWVKEYGAVIIFKKVWEKLGLKRYLGKYLEGRKIEFNAEEVVYTMVLNRILEPKSELATHSWANGLYGVKGVFDINQWYRSLDFLIEHKDELEADLFEAQKDLFNQETDMVLMDTTSVVYFGDGEKAEDILDYGFSKEKRFDLKQVIVGILMTKDGIPIGHEVYPGNTNDINAFKEMIQAVALRFKIRRVIIVCDRGMVTERNIRQLELEMGPIYHYTERRIRAHIFVCFLALLLKVVFQKDLAKVNENLKFSDVFQDIKKIKAVQITLKGKPVTLRTELERDAHLAFKAAGLKIPPRLLSEPPDIRETVVLRG